LRVQRRKAVFVGCEGESEQAYCRVLGDILDQRKFKLHLHAVLIGEGAGSPVAKVGKAIKKIRKFEKERTKYLKKVVLIDFDLVQQNETARLRAEELASEAGIQIVWQDPCHEGFLLRHLDGCSTLRPPTTPLAHAKLLEKWPGYQKPMTRQKLAIIINEQRIAQAVGAEELYRQFLHSIGWS
jgi:hypothetical protein